MNNKYPRLTKRACHKCGSKLLLVDVTVEKMDGQHGDITTSTYRCSDEACQKETDADIKKMKKKREERDAINKRRLEKMQENRKKVAKKA